MFDPQEFNGSNIFSPEFLNAVFHEQILTCCQICQALFKCLCTRSGTQQDAQAIKQTSSILDFPHVYMHTQMVQKGIRMVHITDCRIPHLPNLLWYLACLVWVIKIVTDLECVMKRIRLCLSAFGWRKAQEGHKPTVMWQLTVWSSSCCRMSCS